MNMASPARIDGLALSHVRSIPLDLVLTLITFGLFNIYVQYRQMQAVNAMLREERYNFWLWLLLVVITWGIYHVYHEYRMSSDIARAMGDTTSNEAILAVILTAFFLWIVADAIQQSHINRYFGSQKL